MTARVIAMNLPTGIHAGMEELRAAYRRNALIGLGVALCFHFVLILGYLVTQSDDNERVITVDLPPMTWDKIPQQQSLMDRDPATRYAVTAPDLKAAKGIPVPVPDADVSPERTIADQKDYVIHEPIPVLTGTGAGGSNIPVVMPKIEEDDTIPFTSVEKYPALVKSVAPEYPDMARRTGVEGTVLVHALIDKQGRVRKAEIAYTANEMLNEAALAAARQYLFTPALMNSGPVNVWANIPFRFKLNH